MLDIFRKWAILFSRFPASQSVFIVVILSVLMGKAGGKFVIILQIDRVLSVDEMALLANVAEASPEAINAA